MTSTPNSMDLQANDQPAAYAKLLADLSLSPKRWLVTGAAGFIGCNIIETLLKAGQQVVGLDNFATGKRKNLEQVRDVVGPSSWERFQFIEGDIRDRSACERAVAGVNYVLHQAALGSVPRSIEDPVLVNSTNIDGFVNMLVAARDEGVSRFVYAASSSTYGDHPALPKIEENIGRPLSPYAVTKYVNEVYASVFADVYGFKTIGLRYFNIFGPHQDPLGAYAAVIPKWIAAMLAGESVFINGDGATSRDFCYVANAVQANILAAGTANPDAVNQVYNIAVGERTTLLDLHRMISAELCALDPGKVIPPPEHRPFRAGDVRHSLASIEKARRLLGYRPTHTISKGLHEAMAWYVHDLGGGAERGTSAPS